jgi:hypothetical protein
MSGIGSTADLSKIQVVRLTKQVAGDNASEIIIVDLKMIYLSKAQDFQLQPGDMISVPSTRLDPPAIPFPKDIAMLR